MLRFRQSKQNCLPHLLKGAINLRRSFLQISRWIYIASSKAADIKAFSGSRTGTFVQEKPQLGNQFLDDPLLRRYLQKLLPRNVFKDIEEDLVNFGDSVRGNILEHHNNVCLSEPVLHQYDAWGERVDDIVMHPSWKALHDISAKEGLISIPYENKYNEWSRLYQLSKLYLFSPSSGLYSCPLAMTDGAASILQHSVKEPFASTFKKLTSNNPDEFWTSGQWMTEKRGGSDVGNGTETLAVPQSDGTFKLHGYKWFTSAIDANISLTLARIVDKDGNAYQGSKGLTMFYLETRNKDGSLNGIRVEKLKKKLGTRQMPTAELILDGTNAFQVSESGRGIATISPMLTVTRIHNSITAVGSMRRILNLSKDFATKRYAFGETLANHPLHMQTLAKLEVEQQGGFHLLLKVSHLFGLVENNVASDMEKLLLRILTPLLKLYTGKQAVSVASEGLESFGGHGYLEDSGIPVILRDAQVLSIWEGTTNVLSLDVLRSIQKTNGEVLKAIFHDAFKMIKVPCINNQVLVESRDVLNSALQSLQRFVKEAGVKDQQYMMCAARDFSYSLARTYIGCLLFDDAVHEYDQGTSAISYRWCCGQNLVPVMKGHALGLYGVSACNYDDAIVYGSEREKASAYEIVA